MKYLKTYRIFESISEDAYEKWIKAETEYNAKISEIKSEYLEGVKQCMFDLTDTFDHTSSVRMADILRPNSQEHREGADLVVKFKFKVPKNSIDEFFDILEGLEETVNSYISQSKSIRVGSISLNLLSNSIGQINGNKVDGIYRKSLKDVREKMGKEIKEYESSKLELTGIVVEVEI